MFRYPPLKVRKGLYIGVLLDFSVVSTKTDDVRGWTREQVSEKSLHEQDYLGERQRKLLIDVPTGAKRGLTLSQRELLYS